MENTFFITGLPRSRTAWLANWFTAGDAFCFHDASKNGWTAASIAGQLNSVQARFVGDSDSGLLPVASDIVDLFPDARWLFVRNTVERSAASYRRAFPPENPYPGTPSVFDVEKMIEVGWKMYEEAWSAVDPVNRRELRLDELSDCQVMRDCQEWLTPGRPWD